MFNVGKTEINSYHQALHSALSTVPKQVLLMVLIPVQVSVLGPLLEPVLLQVRRPQLEPVSADSLEPLGRLYILSH